MWRWVSRATTLDLSKYQPIKALKNLYATAPGKLGMRKVLGVSQFVISLFFITTSILIYNQFKHFLAFDYGFQNIVNIELQGADYEKLTVELQGQPEVTTISACDIIPSAGRNNNNEFRRADTKDEYFPVGLLVTGNGYLHRRARDEGSWHSENSGCS